MYVCGVCVSVSGVCVWCVCVCGVCGVCVCGVCVCVCVCVCGVCYKYINIMTVNFAPITGMQTPSLWCRMIFRSTIHYFSDIYDTTAQYLSTCPSVRPAHPVPSKRLIVENKFPVEREAG